MLGDIGRGHGGAAIRADDWRIVLIREGDARNLGRNRNGIAGDRVGDRIGRALARYRRPMHEQARSKQHWRHPPRHCRSPHRYHRCVVRAVNLNGRPSPAKRSISQSNGIDKVIGQVLTSGEMLQLGQETLDSVAA